MNTIKYKCQRCSVGPAELEREETGARVADTIRSPPKAPELRRKPTPTGTAPLTHRHLPPPPKPLPGDGTSPARPAPAAAPPGPGAARPTRERGLPRPARQSFPPPLRRALRHQARVRHAAAAPPGRAGVAVRPAGVCRPRQRGRRAYPAPRASSLGPELPREEEEEEEEDGRDAHAHSA